MTNCYSLTFRDIDVDAWRTVRVRLRMKHGACPPVCRELSLGEFVDNEDDEDECVRIIAEVTGPIGVSHGGGGFSPVWSLFRCRE